MFLSGPLFACRIISAEPEPASIVRWLIPVPISFKTISNAPEKQKFEEE